MYLHFNELTQLPNLEYLPQLTELFIHSNKFSSWLPHSLPVSQVEVLNLGHMEITHVPQGFLQSFPKLIDLNICCNNITETPHIDEISYHLQFVDLSSNLIPSLELSFVKSSKQSVLKVFRYGPIDNVPIVSVNKDFFRLLSNLEEVYFNS